MKFITLFIVFSTVFISCVSTNKAVNTNDKDYGTSNSEFGTSSKINPDIDLTSNLNNFPGITTTGTGANAIISIRGGTNTFYSSNTEPLFIIDGNKIVSGYSSVYSMIRVIDIKNIKVLKGSDAGIYGTQAANGVIIINTK